VLDFAAGSSGLLDLQRAFAVPSQSAATGSDTAWLASPGRYAVSRKCDGTRHLLLVDAGGRPYLLNRAGSLYAYPLLASAAALAQAGQELIAWLPPLFVYECLPLAAGHEPASADAAAEAEAAGGLTPRHAKAQRQAMGRMQRQLVNSCPWLPGSIRWDKCRGNAAAAVELMQQRAAQGAGRRLSMGQLVEAAARAKLLGAGEEAAGSDSGSDGSSAAAAAAAVHPARSLPFEELRSSVMERVEAGEVERWVDEASGLEVFSYTGAPAVGDRVAAMRRGLVLHPPSGSVVATPFVRFSELPGAPLVAAAAAAAALSTTRSPQKAGCGCSVCGCSAEVDEHGERICYCDSCRVLGCSPLQLRSSSTAAYGRGAADAAGSSCAPTAWAAKVSDASPCSGSSSSSDKPAALHSLCAASSTAAASAKVDGSLVIAFEWQGELTVTTRRRMDSEQAGGGGSPCLLDCMPLQSD
jgi:hypothetical protein